MSRVKVTRSFQVTIPREVREKLGILIGDYLEVYVDKHGRIVMEKVKRKRTVLVTDKRLTPEEIEAIIMRGLSETLT